MSRILPSITKSTEELKKLIAEHPDYHIAILAGEDANTGDYSWMYCSCIRYEIGELLDCDEMLDYNDETITDRGRLEEIVEEHLFDEGVFDGKTEEEQEALVKAEVKKYDPYWLDVIFIWASN